MCERESERQTTKGGKENTGTKKTSKTYVMHEFEKKGAANAVKTAAFLASRLIKLSLRTRGKLCTTESA